LIRFENVSKSYRIHGGRHIVLDDVSVTFPTGSRIGVLGLNGSGKSTMLRLIAGGEETDRGRIIKSGRVSFPLGFMGTFEPRHSARENVKFLARIYEMDVDEIIDWIEDFAELGHYFDMPISTYSSGMCARIAFATSFAFDFDVYLVDEAIETGDARFRKKCTYAFDQRLKTASLLLVSQNMQTIRQYCNSAAVLHNGKLSCFPNVEDATIAYEEVLRSG
jgi:capsular polysaccharide transport system ATP-binding protein